MRLSMLDSQNPTVSLRALIRRFDDPIEAALLIGKGADYHSNACRTNSGREINLAEFAARRGRTRILDIMLRLTPDIIHTINLKSVSSLSAQAALVLIYQGAPLSARVVRNVLTSYPALRSKLDTINEFEKRARILLSLISDLKTSPNLRKNLCAVINHILGTTYTIDTLIAANIGMLKAQMAEKKIIDMDLTDAVEELLRVANQTIVESLTAAETNKTAAKALQKLIQELTNRYKVEVSKLVHPIIRKVAYDEGPDSILDSLREKFDIERYDLDHIIAELTTIAADKRLWQKNEANIKKWMTFENEHGYTALQPLAEGKLTVRVMDLLIACAIPVVRENYNPLSGSVYYQKADIALFLADGMIKAMGAERAKCYIIEAANLALDLENNELAGKLFEKLSKDVQESLGVQHRLPEPEELPRPPALRTASTPPNGQLRDSPPFASPVVGRFQVQLVAINPGTQLDTGASRVATLLLASDTIKPQTPEIDGATFRALLSATSKQQQEIGRA
jgi:hypothetical protein